MPSLSYPWLSGPICALIAFNLLMHYYLVVTVSPGFVDDSPRETGRGFLWARPKAASSERPLTKGVRWSHSFNITRAVTSKCRKCGQDKPEVSIVKIDCWHRSRYWNIGEDASLPDMQPLCTKIWSSLPSEYYIMLLGSVIDLNVVYVSVWPKLSFHLTL